MTRYKQTDFEDDVSSLGSVQMNEGISTTATHIRYHSGISLWKTRSKLEKYLIVIVTVLTLLVLVLFTIISTESTYENLRVVHIGSHISKEQEMCLTPSCVKSAAQILTSMDVEADPCQDFYQYACGGWVAANPIPDGKSSWGTFGKLEQQNQLVIKNALDHKPEEFSSKAELTAKVYYESCLDVNETIEALGSKPMLDLLHEVGGWNISQTGFNPTTFNLDKTLYILHNTYNMGGLFTWAVGEDDKNSSSYVIQIDQGGLTLPARDNYLNKTENKKILGAYLEYMTNIGVLLGGGVNDTRRQMQDIINFETELAEITIPAEERRDEEKTYHAMKISEVQGLAPFISWKDYYTNALGVVNKAVTSNDTVVVYSPEYLRKLSVMVTKHMQTADGRVVLNNYLVWQTVRTLSSCLSKPFRDAYKVLRKALIGSEGGEEQWRSCVWDTNNVVGFAVGAMFVREVFNGGSKNVAEAMISDVRTAFKDNLKNLNWMDAETRRAAEEKADAITDMIGYPDFILDKDQLDEYYKDLSAKKDEYFINNIRINKFNLKKNVERLGQVVNKTRWGMSPPTVNAYYSPTKNQIVFPAGILQSPFYDVNQSASLNYGAIGVVMGHELTHAFDDQGREYDRFGNLHKWWNNSTIDRFKNKTECVVEQYSKFEVNGRHVNGKQTLGENIADNGGLKAAFHAYLNHVEGTQLVEPPLPGLNLTHRQLFFLSFAQVWCSSSTPEATVLQLEKDAHSSSKFRVTGPLCNLPEFAVEFKCASNTGMNPGRKCEVW